MTRVSPLFAGLGLTGLVVLGGAGSLLLRRGSHRVAAAPEPVEVEGTSEAVSAPPAPVRARAFESVAAAPSVPAAPPVEPAPSGGSTAVALSRRALLMADHNEQVIEEADEQAFEAMKLADPIRAAIRRINYDYATAAHAALAAHAPTRSAAEQQGANQASSDAADRVRRSALKDLLGVDGVSAFETAEYTAARRLQRKYRKQWAQELEEQAPLPEGLPPRPH